MTHEGGACLGSQGHRVEAQAVSHPVEPLVELGGFKAFDDGRARRGLSDPRTRQVPVARVRHGDDAAVALLPGLVHVLDALELRALVDLLG